MFPFFDIFACTVFVRPMEFFCCVFNVYFNILSGVSTLSNCSNFSCINGYVINTEYVCLLINLAIGYFLVELSNSIHASLAIVRCYFLGFSYVSKIGKQKSDQILILNISNIISNIISVGFYALNHQNLSFLFRANRIDFFKSK